MNDKLLMGISNLGWTFDSSKENLYLIEVVPNSEKEYGQKKTNVEEFIIDNPLLKLDRQSDEIIE